MTGVQAPARTVAYATALGDDALVLAQRLAEWVAGAPQLEEDVALANLALDLLGQARSLLTYAGEVEGAGRDEDDLAYLRNAADFRNCLLVELPIGDFAFTMARQLVFSTYARELYAALSASTDQTLAAVAAKAVPEATYARDHATQWVLRLGDGTAESARRMQAGLEQVAPYVDELFTLTPGLEGLVAAGVAVDPAGLRPAFDAYVGEVLEAASLPWPAPARRESGGRAGAHTEHLATMLDEMQALHRAHPGASW